MRTDSLTSRCPNFWASCIKTPTVQLTAADGPEVFRLIPAATPNCLEYVVRPVVIGRLSSYRHTEQSRET